MTEKEFETQATTLRQLAFTRAVHMGASADVANDVAQEVMLRLWELRTELDRFRSVEALTSRITYFMLVDEWRRTKWNVTDIHDWETADNAPAPDEQLQWNEDARWLEQRMSELPSTQHAILYMRQVEERPTEEIARLLGITPSSVATLLSRARRTLSNHFKLRYPA